MKKTRIPKLLLLSSLVLGAPHFTSLTANLEAEVQNTSQDREARVLDELKTNLSELKYLQTSAIDELTDHAASTYKYDNSYIRGRKSKIRTIDNQIDELGTYLGAQELGEAIGTIIGLAYLLGSEESKKKTDEWIEGHESRHRYEPREMSSDEKKEAIKELNHHKKVLEMSVEEEVEHLKERKRYEIRRKIEESTEKVAEDLVLGVCFIENIHSYLPMEKSLWCKPLTYVVLYSETLIHVADKSLNACLDSGKSGGEEGLDMLDIIVGRTGKMNKTMKKAVVDNFYYPKLKKDAEKIRMTSSGKVSAANYNEFKEIAKIGLGSAGHDYIKGIVY